MWFNNNPSEYTKYKTDGAHAGMSRHDLPKVTIQPESTIYCIMGGYVTISPVVRGTNLTYLWQVIYPNDKFDVLANEHQSKLTIGPIVRRHLEVKFRMVATDMLGNKVYTKVSSLQVNTSLSKKAQSLEPVRLNDHPISTIHRPQRTTLQKYELCSENNSNPNISSNIGDIFGKMYRDSEKIKEIIEDANISLEKVYSKELLRNRKNFLAPIFTSQPQGCTLYPGEDLLLECHASEARSYTWYFDTETIKGYNGYSLRVPNVSNKNEGIYSCTARNEYGFVVSESVNVTILN